MTNWQMIEQITFRCPDCGHIKHEMTPACPASDLHTKRNRGK